MGEATPGDRQAVPGQAPRALGLGFAALTGITLLLIVLGALVRAHGAGLACPDWPLCFGELVPRFDVRVAYEWSHRVLASLVSLGLVGLSVAVLRSPPLRARLRAPLAVAWGLLVAQVLLGALTVWLLLAPWTVTAHLVVGISFCTALLWISRDLLEDGRPLRRVPVPARVQGFAVAVAVTLLAQLILGGWVSSHGAGLACSAFPTCDGESWAPALTGLMGVHVLHRANAALLLLVIVALAGASRSVPRVHRLALTLLRLGVLQIGVGALNVLLQLKVEITGLHTALAAALVLVTGLVLRELVRAPSRAAVPLAEEDDVARSLGVART